MTVVATAHAPLAPERDQGPNSSGQALRISDHPGISGREPRASCPTGFGLFLVLNGVLFVRPAEIIPALANWPIYEVAILVCLLASLPAVITQFRSSVLVLRPGTVCVLGLLLAIVVSHLLQGRTWEAREGGTAFLKIVIYYVLLVGLVDSPARLRVLLMTLVAFILPLAVASVLQYHGIIEIPGMAAITDRTLVDETTGERIELLRLQGLGIFSDPNDFSLVLVAGTLITAHLLTSTKRLWVRIACLVPIGVFGYAFAMTGSRGGLLALLAGMLTYLVSRFGWKRSLPVAVVLLPLLLVILGGRQTKIDMDDQDDTAQGRILLWRDSMEYFKTSPLLGIGQGQLAEENGLVAHNSFVQSFAELGVLGGTYFVGLFYCAIAGLRAKGTAGDAVPEELRRWRPCLMAVTVGFGVGLWSLTRCYTVSTYLFLGLAAAYASILGRSAPAAIPRLDEGLLKRIGLTSVGVLAAIFVFIKVFAR